MTPPGIRSGDGTRPGPGRGSVPGATDAPSPGSTGGSSACPAARSRPAVPASSSAAPPWPFSVPVSSARSPPTPPTPRRPRPPPPPSRPGAARLTQSTHLTLEAATKAARAAVEAAEKDGRHVSVAVVDRQRQHPGHPARGRGGPQSYESAERKAFTAVSWNAPTSELAKRLAQAPTLKDIPGTLFLAGGTPVTAKGAPVAGIGVAGAPSGDLTSSTRERARPCSATDLPAEPAWTGPHRGNVRVRPEGRARTHRSVVCRERTGQRVRRGRTGPRP
ncbi:heme-binding protein [Streptomyces tricolor]|nr:heme-binding protein [Streptomyces tricolor]